MKDNLATLGIFSGHPIMIEPLHVGRPNIGNREHLLRRINDMLDRRWLTNNGPYVQELESRLQSMLGVKHCIAMCNATVALEIAIRALGLKGEVIVPSFTFIATAHALQWQEITPVFCDIDPDTHNIDATKIERMITPRTTGIIGVHVWGRPCNVEKLAEIARKHNLSLLYDSAHAFGCTRQNKYIGNFGNAEVFSFHATKFFNAFEGGAVATNDDDLASKVRLMKNFGFSGYDNVIYPGTNGKMSEASAAMALTSLDSIDNFIVKNYANYCLYRESLSGIPGIEVIKYDESEKNNYQYVVVEVDKTKAGLHRDDLLKVLHADNVIARRYFYPGCHKMEPYRSYFPNSSMLLSETEKVADRVLVLPTGTAIDAETIKTITRILRTACANADDVREKLACRDS